MTANVSPSSSLLRDWQLDVVDRGLVPDPVIRLAIRQMLRERLSELEAGGVEASAERMRAWVASLRKSPITIHTQEANEQHYELPPAFFEAVLGDHLKYSCCYYLPHETDYAASLADAEHRMLALTCERARLADGDRILEIGCGWGSLTLFMAARFPRSTVVAVSNSRPQREFILARAAERGLCNVEVRTGDVATVELGEGPVYDRVVSVEMNEHARNWEALFARIAEVMKPGATFFQHVFSHRIHSYPYEDRGPSDWMARHFFTGGMMPSNDLPLRFQRDLRAIDQWLVDGTHYQKTSEAWLVRMDAARERIEPVFVETYGRDQFVRWWTRWRIFFMACAELWGYRDGTEWMVVHTLFEKP